MKCNGLLHGPLDVASCGEQAQEVTDLHGVSVATATPIASQPLALDPRRRLLDRPPLKQYRSLAA